MMRKIFFIFMTIFSLSLISADAISMGYLGSSDNSVSIPQGISDNAKTEDFTACKFVNYFFPVAGIFLFYFNAFKVITCFEKGIKRKFFLEF